MWGTMSLVGDILQNPAFLALLSSFVLVRAFWSGCMGIIGWDRQGCSSWHSAGTHCWTLLANNNEGL